MPFLGAQQQWPYYLTQGMEGYDPTIQPMPPVLPDVGYNIGTPGPGPITAPPGPGPGPVPMFPGPDQLGGALTPSTPPGVEAKPPVSAEDLAVRKKGWAETINGILADPNTRQAILNFGLNAMQPIQLGQTPGGHLAKAALSGMDTYTTGVAAGKKEKRTEAESKSKINLERAHAEYYRKGKAGGAGGGGTASEVQKVNQIAAALRAGNPEYYAANPGKDILEARKVLDAVKREASIAGLGRAQILPGTDARATIQEAIQQYKDIQAGVSGKKGATVSPGKHQIPEGAQTGTDRKTGRKVYTFDGKIFFDVETGQEVK